MKKVLSVFFVLLIFSNLFAQKNKTVLASSWRDPETQVKMGQFSKILVVAFVKNQANRKIAEDDIIKLLKSKGVASYQYLGDVQSSLSQGELAEKIRKDEFDGAIVMRLMNPDKELNYTPGTGTYPAEYNSFLPFFEGSSSRFNDPEYMSKHDVYAIETNLYSLKQNKLIWNGTTNSVDPKSVEKMIESIGKVLIGEMKKQGFLY